MFLIVFGIFLRFLYIIDIVWVFWLWNIIIKWLLFFYLIIFLVCVVRFIIMFFKLIDCFKSLFCMCCGDVNDFDVYFFENLMSDLRIIFFIVNVFFWLIIKFRFVFWKNVFVENFFNWLLRIDIKVFIMVKFILWKYGKYFFRSDWYFFLFSSVVCVKLILVVKFFLLSLLR